MVILLSIIGLIAIGEGIAIYRLYRMLQKIFDRCLTQEQELQRYDTFYQSLYIGATNIKQQLDAIDINGAFAMDDYVGQIYRSIRIIALQLVEFFKDTESGADVE